MKKRQYIRLLLLLKIYILGYFLWPGLHIKFFWLNGLYTKLFECIFFPLFMLIWFEAKEFALLLWYIALFFFFFFKSSLSCWPVSWSRFEMLHVAHECACTAILCSQIIILIKKWNWGLLFYTHLFLWLPWVGHLIIFFIHTFSICSNNFFSFCLPFAPMILFMVVYLFFFCFINNPFLFIHLFIILFTRIELFGCITSPHVNHGVVYLK